MRLDFVFDPACPWCAIGLRALDTAIAGIGDEFPIELHLQPFELNPDIAPEGEPILDYAARKSGAGADQLAQRHALIRRRAEEVGFDFGRRERVFNTFDAQRLVQWAGGRALPLLRELLAACHTRGENLASHDVLLGCAGRAGLDVAAARAMLAGGAGSGALRERIRHWQRLGIDGVPALIVDSRHLVPGAQSVAGYSAALRQIAAAEV
jgi:predicted DsbA family dithiol-disulfide isomerase